MPAIFFGLRNQAELVMKSQSSKLRVRIYTRKSSEEGLEQEFNSLDANGKHARLLLRGSKGGRLELPVPDRYDDGGFRAEHWSGPR